MRKSLGDRNSKRLNNTDSMDSLLDKTSNESLNQNHPSIYKDESDPWLRICVFQFLATAIFAQGIISARGNPLFIALSLLIAILFSAPFSGGHVNPAVSTAMLFRRQIKLRHYILYSASQFVGSFCGAGIAWYLLDEVTSPHIDTDQWLEMLKCLVGETLGTFIFVLVILIMTNPETSFGKQFQIIIFYTISIALLFSRQLTFNSGGVLNPAVGIGLEIFDSIDQGDFSQMTNCWVYLIGPYLGAILSTIFYSLVYLRLVQKNS